MAYVDTGAPITLGGGDDADAGVTVVMLHGNPTSSWLWRDVIPGVQGVARVLAPDLVGMGSSDAAPDGDYSFVAHSAWLDRWFDAMGLASAPGDSDGDSGGTKDVLLVLHDWGSALGFYWAQRHAHRVAGIVHGESIVAPLADWSAFPEGGRKIFKAMRSDAGEELVLAKNVFVERIFPSSVQRTLEPSEMEGYTDRFVEAGAARQPTLTWPRQIPIADDPASPPEVVAVARGYSEWLATAPGIPKVLLDADPGFFAPWVREQTSAWPDQQVVPVEGLHFFQEDCGAKVGDIVGAFAMQLNAARRG